MLVRLLKSIVTGLLMVAVLLIPLVGAFTVGLLLVPLCMLGIAPVEEFCSNSRYVEFGFAWITLHSWHPFFFYWAWFSLVSFVGYTVFERSRQRPGIGGNSSAAPPKNRNGGGGA